MYQNYPVYQNYPGYNQNPLINLDPGLLNDYRLARTGVSGAAVAGWTGALAGAVGLGCLLFGRVHPRMRRH
ncbi:hypothetical protein ACFWBC_26690 [Streptomyces sp. NPDC059985]|uniref:hypothetical protein n=1 Tax=Streptomyces sp. NPDC059985 TaxID=3347025 RepID=UPI0036A7C036